mmetsp:Transcript_1945/g.4098  ORF Transcript_1945/g.4098 Transcript_1945/m.4098 type:complete len:104 (+) Transcript_1945:982-1293(+)
METLESPSAAAVSMQPLERGRKRERASFEKYFAAHPILPSLCSTTLPLERDTRNEKEDRVGEPFSTLPGLHSPADDLLPKDPLGGGGGGFTGRRLRLPTRKNS